MKGSSASVTLALFASLATTLFACDSGDTAVEGAHPGCAYGGTSTQCTEAVETAEDACWRLVDCGAIALDEEDPNRFDWGQCVDNLERLIDARQQIVISCIAASSCDELRASDHCGQFGDQ